jgi:RNA chaperone Hfq
MTKDFNIQNQFLNKLRKSKNPVIIQIKGDRIFQGIIVAYDNYAILVKEQPSAPPVLIFKHAIAYIIPERKHDEIINFGNEN